MITDSDLKYYKDIVLKNFSFYDDPFEFMWSTEDGEPIDDCDTLWSDPKIYDVKYGCSKAVLFYGYLDNYVLKIPYLGEYDEFSGQYNKFARASKDNPWDYCYVESKIYDMACEAGIEELFCGTKYLCKIDGFPIYLSEKSDAALDEEGDNRLSSKDGINYIRSKRREKEKKFLYCPGDMEDNLIGLFYDSWGKELTDRLLDFLLDNNIRDCHTGNVAFKDGKIRIIDYSSFFK